MKFYSLRQDIFWNLPLEKKIDVMNVMFTLLINDVTGKQIS